MCSLLPDLPKAPRKHGEGGIAPEWPFSPPWLAEGVDGGVPVGGELSVVGGGKSVNGGGGLWREVLQGQAEQGRIQHEVLPPAECGYLRSRPRWGGQTDSQEGRLGVGGVRFPRGFLGPALRPYTFHVVRVLIRAPSRVDEGQDGALPKKGG